MEFNDNHNMRYQDDLDRERIIYYNGQYYRIKEAYFSGGPYSMPHGLWDPFGPWRMARPIPHNLEYWTDLDYRYQNTMKETLKKITTEHYQSDLATVTFNDSLLNAPIGTEVEVMNLYKISVLFGDENLNYSVEIDPTKVYHIDYMSDGKLRSIIGRVFNVDVIQGKDYRGDKATYTILNVDCSNDFNSDKRLVDSRDIRYIQCLNDLQTASSITKTFIGTREPDDPYKQYGAWFNPTTSIYKVRNKKGEWIDVAGKPEENPGVGFYWKFNPDNFQWILNKIPEFKPDDIRECVWEFQETSERWERKPSVSRPRMAQLAKPEFVPNEYWMPNKPESVAYYGKEWYFNTKYMMWTQREPMPKDTLAENKQYWYDETTENWITIPKKPETEIFEPLFYGDDGNGNMGWHMQIVSMDNVTKTFEFDGGIFGWIYSDTFNRWFVTPLVPTYSEKNNSWIYEVPGYYDLPKESREGFKNIFSYYYNRWFYYPIMEDINSIDNTADNAMMYDSYRIDKHKTANIYTETSIMYFYRYSAYTNNDRCVLVGDRHNWDRLTRVDYVG